MQQLENEILQLENKILQVESDNAPLDELNAKIAALWPRSNTNSVPMQSPDSDSPI